MMLEPLFFNKPMKDRKVQISLNSTQVDTVVDSTTSGYKPIQGRRFLRPGETVNLVIGIIDARTKYANQTDSQDQYSVYIVLGNKLEAENTNSIVDSFRNMIRSMVPQSIKTVSELSILDFK